MLCVGMQTGRSASLVEGIGAEALTQPLTEQRIQTMLNAQTDKLTTHITQNAIDLARFIQRNFLRAFLMEQKRELITCPNLFTLHPVANSGGVIRQRQWRIQLYSQLPGAWRKAGDPYTIDEMRDWFKKAAPFLKTLHKALKIIAPLASAALDVAGDGSAWAKTQHDTFDNEIKLMGKLFSPADLLPTEDKASMHQLRRVNQQPASTLINTDELGTVLQKFEGAELVTIRELMDKLAEMDKERGTQKWGGLTRLQTPEGDILWLDKDQLNVYLSKRPIPQINEP